MIVVTGGAGFIGSNLIKGLNTAGYTDIVVADDLEDGKKIFNLSDLEIRDLFYWRNLLAFLESLPDHKKVECVFHQGAISATTEWNGNRLIEYNYQFSKDLLHWCIKTNTPFIYASSASVYGNNTTFSELRENESPINAYAYSKFQFDQYVRARILSGDVSTQVVGLRYFNVYGPRESHKGAMASTVYHFHNQIKENGVAKLFAGSGGYGDGEQLRDFVFVGDIVDMNIWFKDNPRISGIFNAGTGKARTFNDLALAVCRWHEERGTSARIEYIQFPQHLVGSYQNFTEADITALRSVGYKSEFTSLEDGVASYLDNHQLSTI